ncbi:hypothetical protein BSNK01_15620 [Bacillaceae bacterium]
MKEKKRNPGSEIPQGSFSFSFEFFSLEERGQPAFRQRERKMGNEERMGNGIPRERKLATLIITHGSREKGWVRRVDETLAFLRLEMPVVVSFLELVAGRSIPEGVRRLEEQGVTDILAVPLFVCSGSTHLAEIRHAFGLQEKPPFPTDLPPIATKARIHFLPAMDDHPYVLELLTERLRELSRKPEEEVLFLVGHGAEEPGFHERWERMLQSVTRQLRRRLRFKGATYGTLHPDNVYRRAQAVGRKNELVVCPLFLSEGYFTHVIVPQKLGSLSYRYDGRAYLPHPFVAKWVEDVVRGKVAELTGRTRCGS